VVFPQPANPLSRIRPPKNRFSPEWLRVNR
jgi:hypothetical protein